MNGLEKQIVVTLAVAWFFWRFKPFDRLAGNANDANDYDGSTQIWAGAGADPFGYSYTVQEKAMRGGL